MAGPPDRITSDAGDDQGSNGGQVEVSGGDAMLKQP